MPKARKKESINENEIKPAMGALERVSAYARAVCDGEIVAGPHVRNACRRHFDDLAGGHERGIFFSEKACAHVFRFFEKGLTLSDGQFEGRPFKLAPMQAFIVGSIFGWKKVNEAEIDSWLLNFDPEKLTVKPTRRFRRAFIEMGKGQGKAESVENIIWCAKRGKWNWRKFGSLKVGDEVRGRNGSPTKIVGITGFQYGRDCFSVYVGGEYCGVYSDNHIWPIKNGALGEGFKTATTREIFESKLPFWAVGSRLVPHGGGKITAVKVNSAPVMCISVAAKDQLYITGPGFLTHNSPIAGGIGLFGLTADGEPAAQIYAAAAKKEQAQILYQDAVKAARRSKHLSEPTITFSGGLGKEFNMLHTKSMSFFRPISRESGKSGSGPRPHFALCDEVHEHPDRSIMEMLERGFKFRQNPLLLMITNSGVDLNSVCWEEHQHAVNVSAGTKDPDEDFTYVGEVMDDSTFSYVCALDRLDDPLEDESCWIKANPMLGIILSREYLAGVVKQAKDMPGKRNGILRLHFCVWTQSVDAWMAQEKVESCMAVFDPEEIHENKRVGVGIDLSGTRDLTAMAFGTETGTVEVERMTPEGEVQKHTLPKYDVWVEAWTPGDTIVTREEEDKRPYQLWVKDGYLHAVAGERIRYDHVASRLLRACRIFDVRGIAYDNYAYSAFRQECDDMGVDVKHFAHPQGGKQRAKPSMEEEAAAKQKGEKVPPGLWMPGSIKLFEDAVLDNRIRIRLSPVVMAAMMGATMSPEDDMGNKFFVKRKSNARIDPAVAIAMCLGLLDKMRTAGDEKKFQVFFFGG